MTVLRAAVLGSPIVHSLSPALHRAAYAQLELDATYEAFDVSADALAGFVEGLGPEWMGLSLTMPLKEEALNVAQMLDPVARLVGAANTLVLTDGARAAYNTDVDGVKFALDGIRPDAACILGAGASARSAIAALVELGARSVEVLSRRVEAARRCAAFASELGLSATASQLTSETDLTDVQVCVSTLPPRAADEIIVDGSAGVLLDIAYDPWPSQLATTWLRCGGRVISGHEMLLGQAVRQVELMTGLVPDVATMRAGMEAAIVLQG